MKYGVYLDELQIPRHILDAVANSYTYVTSDFVTKKKEGMPLGHYREEFGRVAIHLPRRMGHSTAAIMLLYALDDALLFVKNGQEKTRLREIIKAFGEQKVRDDLLDRIILPSWLGQKSLGSRTGDRSMIIFDGASRYDINQKAKVEFRFPAKLIVDLQ